MLLDVTFNNNDKDRLFDNLEIFPMGEKSKFFFCHLYNTLFD